MTTNIEGGLLGLEVAITGRLGSMSRDAAVERIAQAGGRYVTRPSAATAYLVVGQGGPPLGEDGRLTQSLRTARALQQLGAPLAILPEQEFLTRLGLHDRQRDMHRLYTTLQLSRILEIPAGRIRAWVRHGLIEPVRVVKRLCFFDFQQVATARTLSQLARDGVTPARIHKSLSQLSSWLQETDRSIAQLERLAQSDLLVVRTAQGFLAEPCGQLRLDFEPEPASAHEAPVLDPARRSPEEWYARGIAAEGEGRLRDAVRSYERALAAGGPRPEVLFNLGNALFSLGEKREAAEYFRQATEADEDYVEAWNNFGNTLTELGRLDQAVSVLRHALDLQPDYADAHFNLAEALANLGEYAEARHHWQSYLELDPCSTWATVVRERLRRTAENDEAGMLLTMPEELFAPIVNHDD